MPRVQLLVALVALSSACGGSGSGVAVSKTMDTLNADEKLALCEFGIDTFGAEVGSECSRNADCGPGCSAEIYFQIAVSPVECADQGLPAATCTVREAEAEIKARDANFCAPIGPCGMRVTESATITVAGP